MLVLSRKPNQQIIVGDNVTITILKIRGNTVRIGIDAPREINVMRGELVKDDCAADEDGTLVFEFKTNNNATATGPSLRVVGESDIESPDQTTSSSSHRLHELAAQVGGVEKKVQ